MKKLKYLFVFALASILAACGSAPAIRDSQRLVPDAKKSDSVQFVYRNSDLQTVSSYSRGGVSSRDHGYSKFGSLLTKNAAQVFARQRVTVVESLEVEAKDKIPASGETPILIVYAISGTVRANQHASVENYVFDAKLIDAGSNRVVWKATIDTSTWSGNDFVLDGVKKTLYDDSYAEQLLKSLADRMKEDGVI